MTRPTHATKIQLKGHIKALFLMTPVGHPMYPEVIRLMVDFFMDDWYDGFDSTLMSLLTNRAEFNEDQWGKIELIDAWHTEHVLPYR
jgi:hypothetical protein